jgi:hypothetical protein
MVLQLSDYNYKLILIRNLLYPVGTRHINLDIQIKKHQFERTKKIDESMKLRKWLEVKD